MRWAVEIQKSSLERRMLSDLLAGLGLTLVEGIEYPALASPEIDACVNAEDAFKKGKAVGAAFTGPAQTDPEFVLGSVIDYSSDPPRRLAFMEGKSILMMVAQGSLTPIVSPPERLSPAELERWTADCAEKQYQAELERQRSKLEPAFFNPSAAKVIELLANDSPTGEVLNKIYELAKGAKKEGKFHRQYGITAPEFKRFSDAVNNSSVTGDWARHAKPAPRTQSEKPMSKSEAETFVRGLAAKWLETLRRRV